MYLSQTNLQALRHQVEEGGGFQVALAPMQPATFLNVKMAADALYNALCEAGISVLVDDRNQKPANMFEVIGFLGIRHRVVISSRSISVGVYEYRDLVADEFVKVPEQQMVEFLEQRIGQAD